MMKKDFLIGCCYYPEHWNEADLEPDLLKIKALGFNVVRMGEFSWSLFEKEEGKFDFSLLQKAVSKAEELGIAVILGTPTAAPPKWLTDRHPEVLCKNADGLTLAHGSRQHHNHTSPVYLQYCARITEEMAKAFCGFGNIIGWQIDNELHCHRNESYAESDDIAFRAWLKEKYGSIEAVNQSWGTRFWSLEFNDFEAIDCPRRTVTHKNPALMTDYFLFLSDAAIHFAALQARILRQYTPNAFITHNGYFQNIDYKKLTEECLDFLSFDSYPAGLEKKGPGMGRTVEYRLAQTRGCSPEFMILEQQSGPGGQLKYLTPTPLPGQIRLWTYQSIAHGAVGVLYFRYRTALYGAEQLWYGIYDHDGEESHRSREVRQITQELARLAPLFLKERRRAEVAILTDYPNTCCRKAEPFFEDDSRLIFDTLNSKNVATDILYNLDDLAPYKVVILPHTAMADEEMAKQIQAFTDKGGVAILSAKSGTKDPSGNYRPLREPGVFRPLAGCCVDWFTALPDFERQALEWEGKRYPVSLYYEALQPEEATPLGYYTEGFCAGKPGLTKRGNVYYLGFFCKEDAGIYYDLVRKHLPLKEPIDPHLEEVALGDYTLYLNHGRRPVSLSGYDLIQETPFGEIPPFGVILTKGDVKIV